MSGERSEKALLPGLVNSSKELISGPSNILESRLQLAKDSAEMPTQNKATTTTLSVPPTPPSTSSNSYRPHRSITSPAISNRLADSQILYPGSTEDDDQGDKDNEDNEDDKIHDSDSGREARDAANENTSNKHKTFDRWFITKPVPKNRPNSFTPAHFPAQPFQATNLSTTASSHGSVLATSNAQGGLFKSAFQGGFPERSDAIISIGGPGMGGDRQWTLEATCELVKVTNSDDIAHLDANPEEKHAETMGNVAWRNPSLFPARKKGDSDYLYDLDPRDFNRQFEKQARAAKQAEEEAARKRAEALLAFEKLYVLARENLQPSAKELSATHSWPARTKSYFYDTLASSKRPKEPRGTNELPVQSAKTWPVRNLFTLKKTLEDFNSRATESHMDAANETVGSIVRKFTFGSRNL